MHGKPWLAALVIFFTVNFLLLTTPTAFATDFSSPDFTIKDPVIDLGGILSNSPTYSLNSSFGQEAVGISVSGAFNLNSGFLYYPSPSSPATTTTSPPAQTSTINGSQHIKVVAGNCDFNGDGVCDIVDLSIFLYWVNKPFTIASEKYDLNQDGHLDIADISIIFYYWDK